MSLRVLVGRMTFGFTHEEYTLAQSLGASGYIEYHLDHLSINDSTLDAILAAGYPTLVMTPQQLSQQTTSTVVNNLIRARILRAALSKRQFFERMVEFWTDHFNIWIQGDPSNFLKTVDDRDVIRPHALGKFPDMLRASARSPAMLAYLDNDTNIAGNPNENYARELLELHTLSVDGGYTQQDVAEVARCFTGWNYWRASAGATAYTFRFNASQHDNGQKVVLGQVIPAGGGIQDGETVLNILAGHPKTAGFISQKLVDWLYGPNADQSLVDFVTQAYLTTGGDIKAMVRIILLAIASQPKLDKYKRPFDLFISGLRALSANLTTPGSLQTPLVGAGQLPFNWSPPDGYPDTIEHWVGLMLPRWNFGASLMNNEYTSGVSVNISQVLTGAVNGQQVVDRIDYLLFNSAMPAPEKAAVLQYLGGASAVPTDARKREAIGLALGSPGFQWY